MAIDFPNSLDSFVNPLPTQTLGNPLVLHHLQHSNHNDGIRALQEKVGINFSNSAVSLDFITNFLIMDNGSHPGSRFKEITPPGAPFPANVSWYTNSDKTVKLLETIITRDSSQNPTRIELVLYNGTASNTVTRTIVESISYSGPFEISRTRMIT